MDIKVKQEDLFKYILGLSVVIITLVYFIVTTSYSGLPLTDAENRGIETPLKLWLNGYLGVFFGFKSNGNIIWLLPLLFFFAWAKLKESLTVKLFLVFYLLLFMLIAVKGYINGRYQFTLVPVSIMAIVLLVKELFEEKLQQKFFYLLIAFTLFNTFYFTALDYWPRYKERFFNMVHKIETNDTLQLDYITFINSNIKEDEIVLVNNLPEYFYYTNRKGLFCWTGQDVVYTADGEQKLMHQKSDEELINYLVHQLNCKYFFTTIQLNNYHPEFTAFLERRAELVFNDHKKYLIYKFKE